MRVLDKKIITDSSNKSCEVTLTEDDGIYCVTCGKDVYYNGRKMQYAVQKFNEI